MENRFSLQKRVVESLKECPNKCDEESMLKFKHNEDGFIYRIKCPLFSRECRQGKAQIARLQKMIDVYVPNNIPSLYREELPKAQDTIAINNIRTWSGKGLLYIFGSTGTGKSFSAAWWIREQIKQRLEENWDKAYRWDELGNYKVEWRSAVSIIFDRFGLGDVMGSPLLVIDDLGCEAKTATNTAMIGDILSTRYSFRRPTIVTSNLSPQELEARYDTRLYERITQTGSLVDTGSYSLRTK